MKSETKTPSKHVKATVLADWKTSPAQQPILKHMTPIAYKVRGSRYGACGIRIDGNPEFIDAVLSHLKELINGENHVTRLELARHQVDGTAFDKSYKNAETDAEVCYIRLHMRGREGAIASSILNRGLDQATRTFETSL